MKGTSISSFKMQYLKSVSIYKQLKMHWHTTGEAIFEIYNIQHKFEMKISKTTVKLCLAFTNTPSPLPSTFKISFYWLLFLELWRLNLLISGYVSNYFKDTCIAIEPGTISWLNPWAFFPLLLSTVGIILTLEVIQQTKFNPIQAEFL